MVFPVERHAARAATAKKLVELTQTVWTQRRPYDEVKAPGCSLFLLGVKDRPKSWGVAGATHTVCTSPEVPRHLAITFGQVSPDVRGMFRGA